MKVERVELTKTINKKKDGVHRLDMEKINEATIQDTSFKTAQMNLGIGRSPNGEVTRHRENMVKASGEDGFSVDF